MCLQPFFLFAQFSHFSSKFFLSQRHIRYIFGLTLHKPLCPGHTCFDAIQIILGFDGLIGCPLSISPCFLQFLWLSVLCFVQILELDSNIYQCCLLRLKIFNRSFGFVLTIFSNSSIVDETEVVLREKLNRVVDDL